MFFYFLVKNYLVWIVSVCRKSTDKKLYFMIQSLPPNQNFIKILILFFSLFFIYFFTLKFFLFFFKGTSQTLKLYHTPLFSGIYFNRLFGRLIKTFLLFLPLNNTTTAAPGSFKISNK